MVSLPSKLPSVQLGVVLPKLLRTVERSGASTVPETLASPRSAGRRRMEFWSTGWPLREE